MPEASIWLRVRNGTPFEVTLEQCTLDIWLGQPMAKQIILGHFLSIPPSETARDVGFSQILSASQMQFANDFFAREDPSKTVYLYGTASCRTRVRTFVKQFQFERHNKEVAAILQ